MDWMGQDGIVRTMCDMATQLRGGELVARIEWRVRRGALLVLCGATWLMCDVLEGKFWSVDSVWQLDNVGLASGTRALASFSPCTCILRGLLYFIISVSIVTFSYRLIFVLLSISPKLKLKLSSHLTLPLQSSSFVAYK
jgi:hypothetical protein